MRLTTIAPVALALLLPPLTGAPKFDLTIDNIMRGPGLVGYAPSAVRWSRDSQSVYFEWKRHGDALEADRDVYVVSREGKGLRKLSEEEKRNAPPFDAPFSRDKTLQVFSEKGDIFLYDHSAARRRRLTRTTGEESSPRFAEGDRAVVFKRGLNLFSLSLGTGLLEQLTDIRASDDSSPAPCFTEEDEKELTGSRKFIKEEERALIQTLDAREIQREIERERCLAENPRKPFKLKKDQTVEDLALSPDGRLVIARIGSKDEDAVKVIVPRYVTTSGYTDDTETRIKVGDQRGPSNLLILDRETGKAARVDHGRKQTAAETDKETEDVERPLFVNMPAWSDDGKRAVFSARAYDNKDSWIFALDAESGKTRVLHTSHDDAWVYPYYAGGGDDLLWSSDGERILFLSEHTGFVHLYEVRFGGGPPRPLTSGRWRVAPSSSGPKPVRMDDAKRTLFLHTNEDGPEEIHLYSMSVDGGGRTRLTIPAGRHSGVVSPDGATLAVVSSFSNRPPELYLKDLNAEADPVQVTDSPAPEFWSYSWVSPPIVTIPARDGAQVPARIYKPENWSPGGPAVIFVHGAGYLQNVHRGWSSYYHEFMFHHFLMETGYLVLDADYRGSANYGRDWRTAIYRNMGGGKDLEDHIDAARWLAKEHGVDPERIGIYGGSYGGLVTLMALFKSPGTFAAGAALRPVTDFAHYNDGYTSNILNRPQDDPEAFRRSAPIHFAEGLQDALLICHGMVDTNVHFQDSVRLAQRLIELRKENWELAVYPVENHGFIQPTSWADEYKRIFRLFEENLK